MSRDKTDSASAEFVGHIDLQRIMEGRFGLRKRGLNRRASTIWGSFGAIRPVTCGRCGLSDATRCQLFCVKIRMSASPFPGDREISPDGTKLAKNNDDAGFAFSNGRLPERFGRLWSLIKKRAPSWRRCESQFNNHYLRDLLQSPTSSSLRERLSAAEDRGRTLSIPNRTHDDNWKGARQE